jgi:hypothetical protein
VKGDGLSVKALRRFVHRSRVTHHASRLLAFVLVAGCAIPHVPSRTVYEDPVNYVRLEEDRGVLPEWPPSHHSHPAAIEPERWRTILSGLRAQEHRTSIQQWFQGEAPMVPVFKGEDIVWLSKQIADALAQAKENERVTFYLSEPQTSIKRIITSGGLYLKGTELHFIFGNWQIVYGIPAYGMIYDRRYPMRPTAAKGFNVFFQPPEAMIPQYSSLIDDLLANGKDELVLDLNKIPVEPPVSVPATPPVS